MSLSKFTPISCPTLSCFPVLIEPFKESPASLEEVIEVIWSLIPGR